MPVSETELAALPPSDTRRLQREAAAPPPIICRVENVVKSWEGRRVLDGVSFALQRGRVYSFIGPSGCGKTTLLKSLLGLTSIDSGSIQLLETELAAVSEDALANVRRRTGTVFQSSALISSMTVFENVELPLRLHTALPRSTIRKKVEEKLHLVGMQDAANLTPDKISGGMRKRCAMARAIALDPEILFLDEPTSGADPVTAAMLDDLVLDLTRKLGCAAVSVTHEMRSAFRISHEILMLWQGRIHRQGPPASFIETEDPVVNQFVQGRKEGPLTETRR